MSNKIIIEEILNNISVEETVNKVVISKDEGPQGATGAGVKSGGNTGQVLVKKSNLDYDTEWVSSGATQTEKWEMFEITSDVKTQKYVELTKTITDNQSIRVFVENIGIKAEVGIDFSISGNQIYWSGYNFENLLEIGEKINIFYY